MLVVKPERRLCSVRPFRSFKDIGEASDSVYGRGAVCATVYDLKPQSNVRQQKATSDFCFSWITRVP